jgi:hypothetical protein
MARGAVMMIRSLEMLEKLALLNGLIVCYRAGKIEYDYDT